MVAYWTAELRVAGSVPSQDGKSDGYAYIACTRRPCGGCRGVGAMCQGFGALKESLGEQNYPRYYHVLPLSYPGSSLTRCEVEWAFSNAFLLISLSFRSNVLNMS